MCRHLTKEERLEGWRALGELLPDLRPRRLVELVTALMGRFAQAFGAG